MLKRAEEDDLCVYSFESKREKFLRILKKGPFGFSFSSLKEIYSVINKFGLPPIKIISFLTSRLFPYKHREIFNFSFSGGHFRLEMKEEAYKLNPFSSLLITEHETCMLLPHHDHFMLCIEFFLLGFFFEKKNSNVLLPFSYS